MNILLINPRWGKKKGGIWKEISACGIPTGLSLIAACIESAGIPVSVLDVSALDLGTDDIREHIRKERYDFFGITAATVIYDDALLIAKICKEIWPESKVIMGGVHPTIFPEETLRNEWVDYVVRGEGEKSIVPLLTSGPENVAGVSYKKGGTVIHNPCAAPIEDINALPFPAYHLFPMKKYRPALGGYKRMPAINMITSRGCPGRCTFCFKDMFGTKVRMRSPESLIGEIKMLQRDYNIKEITFYDDTFTFSKERTQQLCQLLIENQCLLSWSCMSRIDYVDKDILVLMKKAGCHQICYGIESADENILKNIRKPLSFTKTMEVCAFTKAAGIDLRLTFMLGNPGETEESIKKTIQYALKLNPDIVLFNITTPYPGSEMFQWADKNKYLNTYDWRQYNLSQMVMNLPTIRPEVVERYYHAAFRMFYFRPSYIFKKILKTFTLQEMLKNVNIFFRLLRVIFG